MKRFTLLMVFVLIVAMPTFAERVTLETARKVATTFLSNNGAKSTQLTDLSREAGFPNLYIFNAGQGFVVMSADDCVQPILGYSLTGFFVAENMPTNVSGWLQDYNDEIQYAIENQVRASDEIAKLWNDLIDGNSKAASATTIVAALVQTQWDQDPLYNNLCPSNPSTGELTVTGCVATAMAQIMKYWGYPSQGIGSHSYTPSSSLNLGVQYVNFGATTYQWNDMPIQLSNSSTTTQINAVATLMYHCGVSVEMMYNIASNGGSGAYTEDIPYALITYFNYKTTANIKYKSNYSDVNDWISMLKTELNASRPIEYNGKGSAGGHAFICDGYDNNDNFHFNWGWSGRNDGFYALTNLVPGSGGSGGGNYNFTQQQCAIFGIEPSTNIDSPSNLTYTLSGLQDITLNWDASSGASSYNVYRNYSLIGNTTSTTYADTAPMGTNDYFIRAEDSNGQQSLPSNIVTVTIDYPTPLVGDLTATLSGSNISLTWTAPEWCYPETPSAILTYGADFPYSIVGTGSTGNQFYWGNRHLANDLTDYNGKALYKVSFYAYDPGAYECFIFRGTGTYGSANYPNELIAHFTTTAPSSGWTDIDFDETVEIDSSQDLWVFIYDPVGRAYPAVVSIFTEHTYGGYCSFGYPIVTESGYLPSTFGNVAWLIKTYVTDGTYTYNLYRNGATLATNLDATSYTDLNRDNTASFYTVKTNYYGGETMASNGVGYALGQASIGTLTLDANDQMTITENSQLTVSGTLSDVSADNLILENGAQLVNSSTGVFATVKKNISGYSGDGGWYTLCAPFVNLTPSADNGLINGSYDLYAYDEDGDNEGKEWVNYKSGSFDLAPSLGYLYANNTTQDLNLSGELNSGSYTQTVNLSYNNAIEGLKGFNLLGNPTTHEISFTKSSDVADGYYYIDNGDNWIYTTDNSVPVGRGFLVKANATGQSVTLNPQSKGDYLDKDRYLTLSIGEDKAYVKLNEGISMPLMNLNGNHSSLYLLCDHKPYAMLVRNNAEALDLCFESKHNGTLTITVDADKLGLNYLHLIDKITGVDVDLLAMPSYTFETKTTDYASRFRLVFDDSVPRLLNDEK